MAANFGIEAPMSLSTSVHLSGTSVAICRLPRN